MIPALLILVLLSISATAWLAVTVRRLHREHAETLRRAEAAWTESLRALTASTAEKAGAEDARHLSLMLDGVASASLRIERRVSALEPSVAPAATNRPAPAP